MSLFIFPSLTPPRTFHVPQLIHFHFNVYLFHCTTEYRDTQLLLYDTVTEASCTHSQFSMSLCHGANAVTSILQFLLLITMLLPLLTCLYEISITTFMHLEITFTCVYLLLKVFIYSLCICKTA